jgi:hypothetical protein
MQLYPTKQVDNVYRSVCKSLQVLLRYPLLNKAFFRTITNYFIGLTAKQKCDD